MENAGISSWTSSSEGSEERDQYQDSIRLLHLMQNDFQGVRRQLESVSRTLAQREALVTQHLEHASLLSSGFHTLRLVPYGAGSAVCQMGKSLLGEIFWPAIPWESAGLEVRCLGKFDLRLSGRRVERWQSAKSRAVFEYLMMKPRDPVIKDVVIEALWPGCTAAAAGNNLKVAIHGIRQTLGALSTGRDDSPYILFTDGGYRLNPQIELWIDVEEFERHWARGRSLEKAGKPDEAIREFEKAESLYRGDYLEDEPYEEWALLRREGLKDTYLTILSKLADYSMRIVDHESGIVYCQKILEKDPCREDVYRRIIRCYSRSGQRNRALRWYEICRQAVQRGLDAVPERETTALYQQLLNGDNI